MLPKLLHNESAYIVYSLNLFPLVHSRLMFWLIHFQIRYYIS